MIESHPYLDLDGFQTNLNLNEQKVHEEGFLPGGIWFEDTETIFCGTFPPLKEYDNRKGYIHYSNSRNKFWKHIDFLYSEKLHILNKDSNVEYIRIENALRKIDFLKKNKIGLIDIFTKVKRTNINSTKDTDLTFFETFFNNGTFDKILENKNVKRIIFVYSLSNKVFEKYMYNKIRSLRPYNTDGYTLEIKQLLMGDRNLSLIYCPIHGNIKDDIKRKSLEMAITS